MNTSRDFPKGELPPEFIVRMFPLKAPLFPGVRLPFHVFEPRYRAMLADALDNDGSLAIPFVRHGPVGQFGPEIAPIFGIGDITGYTTLEDGTTNIEVLGRCRVRLVEEIPASTLYRQARVVRMDEILPSPTEEADVIAGLRKHFDEMLRIGLSHSARTWLESLFDTRTGAPTMGAEVLVNMISTLIIGDPNVRQAILEESSIVERSRHLGHILSTLSDEFGR